MDSRFFVSKPIQKDSFFTIRKVGIRETEDSEQSKDEQLFKGDR